MRELRGALAGSGRGVLAVAAAAVLAYIGACAWLYASRRSLLYFPRPAAALSAAAPFDVESQGLRLRGSVLRPGLPHAVLYFGGNAEQVEAGAATLAAALPGYSLYLLPYRGYGGNPGQPTEAALLADALAAFDAIAPRHASVSVIGTSLGSGVATHVAARRPVERLALVMPYDSIENVAQYHYPWLPVAWLLEDKFESWRDAGAIHAEVLVLIAERDQVVPRVSTDRLLARFAMPPHVRVVEGADHHTLTGRPEFLDAIAAFFVVSDADQKAAVGN